PPPRAAARDQGRSRRSARPLLGRARRRDGRNAERDRVGGCLPGRPLRDRDSGRRRVWSGGMNYLPLLGIALVVLGFALRFNPLLVVAVAAIVTGLLGHMPFLKVLGTLGHGFTENRYVSIIWIVLPVIGLLERYGLQERARALIADMRGATAGLLLIVYLGFRQIISALWLTSVAGQAQTVRPLVAPMAVAAAEKQHGELDEKTADHVMAMAAATDNVG